MESINRPKATTAHRAALTALGVMFVATFVLLVGPRRAVACETPVYRYAMYSWTPSPYRIYHISRGEPLAEDDLVRAAVARVATPAKTDGVKADADAADDGTDLDGTAVDGAPHPVANLELFELDAAAADPLASLPPPLRGEAAFVLDRATTGDDPPTLPRFAVVLPNGYPVYEGPLSPEDIAAIADSPVRRKVVELLAGGKAAVMLLVEGEKSADNEAAEKLVSAAIARAATGELSPPPDPSLSTTDANAKPPGVDVGLIRVRRDDPAEKWLLMSLLHIEPEIAERTDPMVFTVYARGRVHPPIIGVNLGDGLGICDEGLDREVRFVLGPCACEIKEGNPGMDLALVADWEAIALAMAKRFGSETGNERLLGEVPGLFPEIVDIGPIDRQPPAEAVAAADTNGAAEIRQTSQDASASNRSAESPDANPTPEGGALSDSARDDGGPEGFRTGMSLEEATRKESGDSVLMRNVGIGVLVVMLLLGVASISLFRRPV